MLTQELMLQTFEYREGRLHWKYNPKRQVQWNAKHVGHEAGCRRNKDGRKVIRFEGKLYLASRLIFLYHKGFLPEEVDHKNKNPLDDQIDNLREADRSLNNSNTNATGTTRFRGKWLARLYHKGQSFNLGIFDLKSEAHQAYLNKKKELGLYVEE